jgi:hypothetical protein
MSSSFTFKKTKIPAKTKQGLSASGENVQELKYDDNRGESATQLQIQDSANNSNNVTDISDLLNQADKSQNVSQLMSLQSSSTNKSNVDPTIQKKKDKSNLPGNLKSGIENLSGQSMDDVTVHQNSDKPAQLQAAAYAQGNEIHLAPGQEKHLPHEAWHVVQQKQGRVEPTKQINGNVNVNDDLKLEKEADIMGAKASTFENNNLEAKKESLQLKSNEQSTVQMAKTKKNKTRKRRGGVYGKENLEEESKGNKTRKRRGGVYGKENLEKKSKGDETKKDSRKKLSRQNAKRNVLDQEEVEVNEELKKKTLSKFFDPVISSFKSAGASISNFAKSTSSKVSGAIESKTQNVQDFFEKSFGRPAEVANSKLLEFSDWLHSLGGMKKKDNPNIYPTKAAFIAAKAVPIVGTVTNFVKSVAFTKVKLNDFLIFKEAHTNTKSIYENLAKVMKFGYGKSWRAFLKNVNHSIIAMATVALDIIGTFVPPPTLGTAIANTVKSSISMLMKGVENTSGIIKWFQGTLHKERRENTKYLLETALKDDEEGVTAFKIVQKLDPSITKEKISAILSPEEHFTYWEKKHPKLFKKTKAEAKTRDANKKLDSSEVFKKMSSKSGSKGSTGAAESSLVLGSGGLRGSDNAYSVHDENSKGFISHGKDFAKEKGGNVLEDVTSSGKKAGEVLSNLASNAFDKIKNASPISDLL